MPRADYSDARGSSAGDDYHELWALVQALSLLDWNTEFKAVAVEGIPSSPSSKGSWRSVDCAFLYGGETYEAATKVIIHRDTFWDNDFHAIPEDALYPLKDDMETICNAISKRTI